MMRPKILAENAVNDHVLIIEFDNRQKKKYDLAPLLLTIRLINFDYVVISKLR